MTTQTKYDEVLKMALEGAANYIDVLGGDGKKYRQLLAQQSAERDNPKDLLSNEQVEPVAVYGYCPECGAEGVARERRPDGNDCCANGHTYPSRTANKTPQRTWVGLTEEDVIDLWPDLIMHRHTYQFWQNLEAKLKEKNNGS